MQLRKNLIIYQDKKLLKVYGEIDAKQVFGATEIQQILYCSSITPRVIMSKLKEIEVVKAAKSNGKGDTRLRRNLIKNKR